ncbi:MAG: hypothetical protein RLZZ426_370 [Actinomycetota bacterium]|jgi:putative SOS response-associated peptidase YedK
MCGRYVAADDPHYLAEIFDATETDVAVLPPNFNVAPTQPVYVVDELSGQRSLRIVNWGLIPSWAKDGAGAARLINARGETVAEKPSFRQAFAATRCLVPMTGWFEWQSVGVTEKAPKQPFYLHRPDGGTLAIAGLLEAWKQPETGQWLRTMSLITTDASADIAAIHDRMPVVLEKQNWNTWLDPTVGATASDKALLQSLLVSAPAGSFEIDKVSPEINKVRNNDPALLSPIA